MKIYTKDENGNLVQEDSYIKNVDTLTLDEGQLGWSFYQSKLYKKENGVNVEILQPASIGAGNYANNPIIGEFVYYMGEANPDPAHLLVCDGSAYDTTEWADLYSVLGTDHLPNMVNRMLRGAGSSGKISNHDTVNLMTAQDISAQGGFHRHTALYPTVPHTHTVSVQGEHRHTNWSDDSNTWFAGSKNPIITITVSEADVTTLLGCPTGADSSSYTSGASRAGASQGTYTMTGNASTPISDGTNGAVRVGTFTKGKTRTCLILIRGKL